MDFQLRKLRLWFITLIILVGLYLVYSRFANTPKIQIGRALPDNKIADSNEQNLDKPVAKVGEVGLGTLEMARFTTLNPRTKQLEREFGFERLLHEDGQQWEIEKPYMNIYRPDLKCYVTADRGFVVLESGVSPPSPKDATLTGNVIAHIVPEPGSDIEESFIYLDDLMFVSNRSEFSTEGPVRFISGSAQLAGRGLRLIYDDSRNRLALLRIKKVEDLRFKVSERYSLTKSDDTSKAVSDKPSESTVKSEIRADGTYQCILDDNVAIETQDELILASRVSISDIVWSSRKSEKTNNSNRMQTSSPKKTEQPAEENTENLMDITVKCDNGIAVVPSDSLEILETIGGLGIEARKEFDVFKPVEMIHNRTVFAAQQINYSVKTADAVAHGLSNLKFYVDDVIDQNKADEVVPVILTAKTLVRFAPKKNKIIFEGDCFCSMAKVQEGIEEQYTLSAPSLIVDLFETQDAKTDISLITAIGDEKSPARLASVRKDNHSFLGGIELKCPRFEYNSPEQLFVATGPGVIKADNSKIPQPKKRVGRFSLQRPCYAVVRNFQRLEYYLDNEQIIANNDSERILIDYFPIGEQGQQQVSVTAGRIEADLVETESGQKRLWALLATNGISFRDQDKLFEGSSLYYDDRNSIIKARGDESMPAYFNGAMFDGIEYDLASEQVKNVKISGPGFLHTAR